MGNGKKDLVQAIQPKFETRMPMSSQLNAVIQMAWGEPIDTNPDPHGATMSGDDLYHLFSVILGDGL